MMILGTVYVVSEVRVLEEFMCKGKDLNVVLAIGDITIINCDAIVNPANSLMIMGGGVAGAIRRTAGRNVEEEARRKAPVPVGRAIVTSSGKLAPKIKYIIHAPTMERPAMRTTEDKVKKAVKAALHKAAQMNLECIAFPAMGAGVGGLSAEESMKAMLEALDDVLAEDLALPKKVVFVAYTEGDLKQFRRALSRTKMRNCIIEKRES